MKIIKNTLVGWFFVAVMTGLFHTVYYIIDSIKKSFNTEQIGMVMLFIIVSILVNFVGEIIIGSINWRDSNE